MKTIVMIAAIALSMQASGRTANAPEGYCIPEACQHCDCRRITGLPESNGIAGTIDNGHRPWNPCYPCPARPGYPERERPFNPDLPPHWVGGVPGPEILDRSSDLK
jgi:hypothetical protein